MLGSLSRIDHNLTNGIRTNAAANFVAEVSPNEHLVYSFEQTFQMYKRSVVEASISGQRVVRSTHGKADAAALAGFHVCQRRTGPLP